MAFDRSEPARGMTHRMRVTSIVVRPLAAALAAALMLAALAPMAPRPEPGPVKVRAAETTQAVNGTRDFDVSPDSTHVAIHWAGHPDAVVTASFSTDGRSSPSRRRSRSRMPSEGRIARRPTRPTAR